MSKATALSLDAAFESLTHLPNRTPEAQDVDGWFGTLSDYRDGGVFVASYAGSSEWERHPEGDEIVMVIEGETTIFLLRDGEEEATPLKARQLIVVPQGTWHRFETPSGVRILTVTPQPTDHTIDFPG